METAGGAEREAIPSGQAEYWQGGGVFVAASPCSRDRRRKSVFVETVLVLGLGGGGLG